MPHAPSSLKASSSASQMLLHRNNPQTQTATLTTPASSMRIPSTLPRRSVRSSKSKDLPTFVANSNGTSNNNNSSAGPGTMSNNSIRGSSRWASSSHTSRRFLRAAESGRGTLLPDHYHSQLPPVQPQPQPQSTAGTRQTPGRTRSSPSLNLVMGLGGRKSNNMTLPTTNSDTPSLSRNASTAASPGTTNSSGPPERSLRRRATSCNSDDEEGLGMGYQLRKQSLLTPRSSKGLTNVSSSGDFSVLAGGGSNDANGVPSQRKRSSSAGSMASLASTSTGSANKWHGNNGHQHGPWWSSMLFRTTGVSSYTSASFNLGPKLQVSQVILQVILVLAVTILVWESHYKANFATKQLAQFQDEESLLLLHLQKIEQQSIQLHENLNRLAKSSDNDELPPSWTNGNKDNEEGEEHTAIDFELIQKQTQQLKQMEEEINAEVETLQTRIQQSARSHIIQEFGEGPVQVVLDLDFDRVEHARVHGHRNWSTKISILLWHDTPHAAWTWLEQIVRGVWDHSEFVWSPTSPNVLESKPRAHDPDGGKLEFIEQSHHGHEAWTVGLRESNDDPAGLSMYINLQDNTAYHRHETCVGKIIDGFDALQRLLEVSRSRNGSGGGGGAGNHHEDGGSSIHIRSAVAMHVTKHDGTTNNGAGAANENGGGNGFI